MKRASAPVFSGPAACTGMDVSVFYPKAAPGRRGRYDPADVAAAKAICRGCPVRDQCLSWALSTGEQWGIWGGHTSAERDRLHRMGLTGKAAS